MIKNIIHTGLTRCFDQSGKEIPCPDSGQDASFRTGQAWPRPRFEVQEERMVLDRLTGLTWTRKVNFFDFPLTWSQALDQIKELNEHGFAGFYDWRLPNRRELRSVISHGSRKPALPVGHPFEDVFQAWYWTSTTAAIKPAYAWYVHLEGGRMFFGGKTQRYLCWPVRGEPRHVVRTGQTHCFDDAGHVLPCPGTGQDGEFRTGVVWPDPRFIKKGSEIHDLLTGLIWLDPEKHNPEPCHWEQALTRASQTDGPGWRLPDINELESLVDASAHTPALPRDFPGTGLKDGYWSSTTSIFEPDWAFALYLYKGAVGVGHKPGPEFFVWPVKTDPLQKP
ncbi:MAG: DUF1566 domain-containing protein [Desulfonatronovibrio sp.]